MKIIVLRMGNKPKLGAVLLSVLLSGCGMSAEETAKEVEACKKAGLFPKQIFTMDGRTAYIRCDINEVQLSSYESRCETPKEASE